ncbi:MAG: hypothetical protein GY711_00260 [bacterium]|nr:hypothetical protein [bacterium]
MISSLLIAAATLWAPPGLPQGSEPLPGTTIQPDLRIEFTDKVKVELDPGLGVPVVEAATTRDAIHRAIELLPVEGAGAQFMRFPSGYGIVAGGVAHYDASAGDSDFALLKQRRAWNRAHLDARRVMLESLMGMSVEAKTELKEQLATIDRPDASMANLSEESEEAIRSRAAGFLRGAVTYHVDDNPTEGRVIVRLVVTPATLAARATVDSQIVRVREADFGLSLLRTEILTGAVPARGSRLILIEETGERIAVGFGSALVRSGNARMRAKFKDRARRKATLEAEAELVAALEGQSIRTSSSFDQEDRTFVEEFDASLAPENVEAHEERVHEFIREAQEDEIFVKIDGQLPPGTTREYLESKDGRWIFAVRLYRGGTPRDPEPKDGKGGDPSRSGGSDGAADPGEGESDPACKPGPHAQARVGRGHGGSYRDAVSDALLDAVRGYYGVRVESNERLREEFVSSFEELAGRVDSILNLKEESQRDLEVKSAGMVFGYLVLSHREQPGDHAVRLCVEMPDFDQSGEIPWRRPTLAVAPVTAQRPSYSLGEHFDVDGNLVRAGTAKAAHELTRLLETQLISDLALPAPADFGNLHFLVVDQDPDVRGALRAEHERIGKGVAGGRMAPRERHVKAGSSVGVDYMLFADLHEIAHATGSRKLFKKTIETEKVRLVLEWRLVEVATGADVVGGTFDDRWSQQELSRREGVARNMSSTGFALASAVQAIGDAIFAKFAGERERSDPPVYVGLFDGEHVVRVTGAALAPGQKVEVLKSYETQAGTKPFSFSKPIATLEVTRYDAQQGTATAKLVDGELDDDDRNLPCRILN